MTNITGARMTHNIAASRSMVDMAKDIALLDPNEGPFLTFLKVLRKDTRVVYNPKFEWLEDDLLETWSQVRVAISSRVRRFLAPPEPSVSAFRVRPIARPAFSRASAAI